MKILKIILSLLAILFGGILFLYNFIQLFKSVNGLIEVRDAFKVGYHIGYLISTVLMACIGAWLVSKGVKHLIRKKATDTENDREFLDYN